MLNSFSRNHYNLSATKLIPFFFFFCPHLLQFAEYDLFMRDPLPGNWNLYFSTYLGPNDARSRAMQHPPITRSAPCSAIATTYTHRNQDLDIMLAYPTKPSSRVGVIPAQYGVQYAGRHGTNIFLPHPSSKNTPL